MINVFQFPQCNPLAQRIMFLNFEGEMHCKEVEADMNAGAQIVFGWREQKRDPHGAWVAARGPPRSCRSGESSQSPSVHPSGQ
jgi:hypothetical protein